MFEEKYRFFVEIAKCGSVTKAADHLLISQSALSKYLHRLEESLSAELFDRTVLPLKLTKSGELFLRYVVQGINQEKQCFDQLHSLQGSPTETLRIGIGQWRGSCLLPQILPQFREQYPFVRFEIKEGVSDVLADAMQKGNLDLCLIGDSQRYPYFDSIHLCDEKILMVGNNANALVSQARMKNVDGAAILRANIADYQQETFILTTSSQGFARHIWEYFSTINFMPTETLLIENLQTGMYMSAHGNYFSFLPEVAVHTLLYPDNITFFTLGEPPLTYPISIAYCKNQVLSHAAKLFISNVTMYYDRLKANR